MYEQDNISNNNENGNPPEQKTEAESEYRYVKEEIPHRSYMDASFSASSEGYSAPRSYYTPPEKLNKKQYKKDQRAAKKAEKAAARASSPAPAGNGGAKRWAVLVCACLVCALLGGLGGGAIVANRLPASGSEAAPAPQTSGSVLTVSPTQTPANSGQTVSSGSVLTGSQIYALGCPQSVGITTEVTYTNFFGMQTTSPVSGSGFIVTSDGYIVTNYHVIEDALKGGYDVSVFTYDGKEYPATIVGGEEQNDIAVLKINATGLSAATLGNSDSMAVGETVYAIGNPLGELTYTMTTGSVSALDREITTASSTTGARVTNNMFQIDAAVNSGNSGGPVYNNRGEVIGIVTAKSSITGTEGLGFAIPINDALNIVNDLIDKGYVSGKPSFGIVVNTVDSSVAQYYNMVEGAYVYSVNAGSCAEAAGLKTGDIITALNDEKITSKADLQYQKKSYKAGDTVTLTVYRGGEYIDLEVTLDEEQPEDEDAETAAPETPQQGSIQGLPKQ